MKSFVDPHTGRLAMPEIEPEVAAAQQRRQRLAMRLVFAFGLVEIVILAISVSTLPSAYGELRLASAAALALSAGLVGMAAWMIRTEK
jgi:hypothetical protein